jgi:hypothetical protein
MKIFTNRLRTQGYPVGDRVSFLVIEAPGPFLGDKLILPEEFDPKVHTLNYDYYIDALGPNIDHLCLDLFPDVSDPRMFRQSDRYEPVYINQPVKFIKSYYKAGHPIDTLVPPIPIKEPDPDPNHD